MPSTPTPPTFTTQLFLDSPILPIQILDVFGLFRLTFSKLIFCIPAGWPKFFPGSLSNIDVFETEIDVYQEGCMYMNGQKDVYEY